MCEMAQLKMYKIAKDVNSKATIWAELGRFPIHIKVFTSVLKYLCRECFSRHKRVTELKIDFSV